MSIKVILFAFRKSHKSFFENLVSNTQTSAEFDIISTRDINFFSLKGIKDLSKVNLKTAQDFAVDELFAKLGGKFFIPKILVKVFFFLLSYINYFRYYKLLNNEYDKMLIWNGGKFRQRIAIEIARLKKIEVFYFENGLLPDRVNHSQNKILQFF